MASNEVEIRVTADTRGAERGLKGMGGTLNKFSRQAKMAGAALTGIAAGGAFFMKSMAQAALVQDQAMALFLNSAKNVGTEMGGLEEQVLAVTAALQNKTNFGDEEQLAVLAKMIPMLGSTEAALAALPIVMDAAATTGRPLAAQAETLTKAFAGTVHQAESLGLKFAETDTMAERMTMAMELVGGAAEASADPFTQLGNAVGDAKEKIGEQFLPVVAPLINMIQKLVEKFQAMNPQTHKMIGLIIMATVAFGAIAGPILLFIGFLPALIGGLGAIAAAALPVTLAIAGIAAAVAIGVAVWRNWDTVVSFLKKVFESNFAWLLPGGALIKSIIFLKDNWREVWNRIQEIFGTVVKTIISGVESILHGIVDMVNGALRVAKKLGLLTDVAEIEKFEFNYADMAEAIGKKTSELTELVIEKTKDLGVSMKQGLGGAATDVGGMFTGMMDKFGLGIDKVDTQMQKGLIPTLNEGLPSAAEKGKEALEAMGETAEKTGKKVKSFNDLVKGGQFKSRVIGGMPGITTWGGGGDPQRIPVPTFDFTAQLDSLVAASQISNQTLRDIAFKGTSLMSGGRIFPELMGLVDTIQERGNFTDEKMKGIIDAVDQNTAIQAKQQSIREAWLANPNNPLNKIDLGRVDPEGLIPAGANGGIVRRPTVALVGEAGPEAIIPLSRGGVGMGPTYNITISGNTVFGEMDFKRLVVKAVTDSHRRGGLPFLGKA